jgi:hypothetical protein
MVQLAISCTALKIHVGSTSGLIGTGHLLGIGKIRWVSFLDILPILTKIMTGSREGRDIIEIPLLIKVIKDEIGIECTMMRGDAGILEELGMMTVTEGRGIQESMCQETSNGKKVLMITMHTPQVEIIIHTMMVVVPLNAVAATDMVITMVAGQKVEMSTWIKGQEGKIDWSLQGNLIKRDMIVAVKNWVDKVHKDIGINHEAEMCTGMKGQQGKRKLCLLENLSKREMTVAVKSWVNKIQEDIGIGHVAEMSTRIEGQGGIRKRSPLENLSKREMIVALKSWVNKVQNTTEIGQKAELTTRIEGQGGQRKRSLLEHLSEREMVVAVKIWVNQVLKDIKISREAKEFTRIEGQRGKRNCTLLGPLSLRGVLVAVKSWLNKVQKKTEIVREEYHLQMRITKVHNELDTHES